MTAHLQLINIIIIIIIIAPPKYVTITVSNLLTYPTKSKQLYPLYCPNPLSHNITIQFISQLK